MLPLPSSTVTDIIHRLAGVKFSQIYGAFEGREILNNAGEIVRRSGKSMLLVCESKMGVRQRQLLSVVSGISIRKRQPD